MAKVICQNCDAEFDEQEVKCPYCGFLYAPGMEKKYMSDLEDKRQALDVVDDEARADYRKEATTSGKKALRAILIVAAILLVIFGASKLHEYLLFHDKYSTEEELLWQQETFPILDKYFEEGDYDACEEILYSDENKDHHTWDWQHYEELRKILDEKYNIDTGGEDG